MNTTVKRNNTSGKEVLVIFVVEAVVYLVVDDVVLDIISVNLV
ncbi:MAG: hypothetical protein ACFFFH_11430 [Candidatus Thorarchaeota archaeon]